MGAKRRAEAPAGAARSSTTVAGQGSTARTKGTTAPKQEPDGKGDASTASAPALSIEDRLQKLDSLLKKGLVSKPEYDKKKAELLKEL